MAETAESLKAQGNELYQAGDFLKAAATYSKAIKLDPENAVLYSNRSAALLKLKKISKATEDAEKCIQLRPDWEKGYFRKGAILEDQESLPQALEVYQAALKLCPESKELSQKIKGLSKIITSQRKKTSQSQTQKETAATTTNKTAKEVLSSAVLDASNTQTVETAADPVYEDLGSEEVAAFTEEYLRLLADEVREHGTDFIPAVHLLPGPGSESNDEQQQHVRAAGAWENPETLRGFIDFLRNNAEKLDAQAAIAVVPKQAISFPQTWQNPKWPCGTADGVFAQLESKQGLRKCWFIPVQGKAIGTPQSISSDFGPMPRVLRT